MSTKRLNSNVQDFHAISSLITHFNPTHKRNPTDPEIPEPEQCPKPHSTSNVNYLSVPNQLHHDSSFRSLSSRGDQSKRAGYSTRRDHTKRSVDITKRSSSPFTSPRTSAQDAERMIIIEQQMKVEREKYKKLEKKYKELMAMQAMNQERFEGTVQELQKMIEHKKGEKVTMQSVIQDVKGVKERMVHFEEKFDELLRYLSN